MATFRSIKELTRALQQGSKLLSNMFLQRKTIAVKYDDALDTLDGDENKLKHLIIFADPLYALQNLGEIPNIVFSTPLLAEGGTFILEHGKDHDFSDYPRFQSHRNYGSVNFSFFQ